MRKLALLLAVVALAACGGDDDGDELADDVNRTTTTLTSGGTILENPADDGGNLAFEKSELSAPPGNVTLVMENPSPLEHNIAIRGNGVDVKGEVVGEGGTSRATADLDPGEYEFYCSVPGHEDGGMKGTLSVG